MDLGDHVLNSLVAAMVLADTGRIYLVGRNLEAVWSAEEMPRELHNFVDDDLYKQLRQDVISEARYEAIHVAFTFGVKLLKLVFRYYPSIWNMTGGYSTSLFKRAVLFYALDSFLTRIIFVPVAFVDAVITKKMNNPFVAFFDSILRNAVNAAKSAVGAIAIIYITDKFGPTAFVVVSVASSIFGLLSGAMKIKLKKTVLQPLRNDTLGEKVKTLAKHLHFSEHDIFIETKSTFPAEVKYDCYFGSHIMTINSSLMTVLTPEQITSLVAHELGHWRYHHPTFHQAFSIFHSACLCFVCLKSLGNESISSHFGFPEKPHPFVCLFLSIYYIWPLAKAALDGFDSITRRSTEFVADGYALAEGYGSSLRTSILTLAGQRKSYPIFDPWYSGWVYGYPTVFERTARMDPRKRVTIQL